jgi:hypothetical protein
MLTMQEALRLDLIESIVANEISLPRPPSLWRSHPAIAAVCWTDITRWVRLD